MQTLSMEVIADQVIFVNLDITCWSGKKNLTPEDLGLRADQLPPETLVSLGDKQLIDPAALREFTTLRSAARRYCLAVGTRFMGGYLVPAPKARALLQKLSMLEQQYNAERAAFLARFDSLVTNWICQQPPEWQRLIREALVPAEYVGQRLRFAVQAVQLTKPAPAVVEHHGLNVAIGGLSGQLFHEIALMARETLEKSLAGKTEVTRRILSPFRTIRDKLDGLAFIDGRIGSVVREIDRLLAAVPRKPPIKGPVLKELSDFLTRAAQPERLKAYAEGLYTAGALNVDLAYAEDEGSCASERTGFPKDTLVVFEDNVEPNPDAVHGIDDSDESTDIESALDEATDSQVNAGKSDDWFF